MDNGKSDSYKVLLQGGEGEYVEKKSRFIATLRSCESEAEALAFIEAVRKKYWDARHNCYAFVIGGRGELARCSDDGEPGGTAGRPMLEVLTGEGIRNVAVVVTRYFGGVLLGTGGLARAYTQAVKEGLKNCRVGRMCRGCQVEAVADYNDVGKVLHLLGSIGMEPVSADYGEKAVLVLEVPVQQLESLRKNVADVTGGRVELLKKRDICFVEK